MSVWRCAEPGWVELACPDGRRGLWMRVTDATIEFCAGREGDDEYRIWRGGERIVAKHIEDLRVMLSVLDYAHENAMAHDEGIRHDCAVAICAQCRMKRPLQRDDAGTFYHLVAQGGQCYSCAAAAIHALNAAVFDGGDEK